MADKPLNVNASRPVDVSDKDQRLGGPDGLYDSPNWDRETTGGIVQRVRAPAAKTDPSMFWPGGVLSVNDSDDAMPMGGMGGYDERNEREGPNEDSGTAFRKSIRGSNM